jgi:hypothetical protein
MHNAKRSALAAVLLLVGIARLTPAQEESLDAELEALRHAAGDRAAQEVPAREDVDATAFRSGGLGLQALNPEISVTGEFFGTYQSGDGSQPDWDFSFRGLGMHLEAYLDPYSRFKAAVPVSAEGAELGEAYYTRYGALGGGNLTLGKFRQQFGVVNRWHKHGLDFAEFPLPLRMVFGDGGLNQTGASADWSASRGASSAELTLQVTDGENARMFGQNDAHRPSALVRGKFFRDASASTYFELGLTGLIGWNDTWAVDAIAPDDFEHATRVAQVYGIDFTILWEPVDRMRYRNVEWRTEFYYVHKEINAPDQSGDDALNPWGAYTSLQAKLSRTVDLGIRFDYFQPEVKGYADIDADLSLSPLAVTEDDAHRWLGALYLTWWQSPFVKYRLQYEHEDGSGMGEGVDRVMFQCVFAAGPHKHERY